MEIKIWAYSDGNDFPNRRPSFFRRHWKALLLACVVIILGIATLTSIATRTANQPSFRPDSPYVYDGAAAHLDDSSISMNGTPLGHVGHSSKEKVYSSISMNGAPLRFERHDHPSDLLVQSLHRTLDILVDLNLPSQGFPPARRVSRSQACRRDSPRCP